MRCLIAAALAASSVGYRYYLGRMPNANMVPAVGTQAGAWNGICEAWGHEKCSGNHDTEGVGNAFQGSKGSRGGRGSSTAGGQWRVDFCAADSDGDGLTNGDELGDPCCRWQGYAKGMPDVTTGISNPGEEASRSSRPSCSVGPLGSPANFSLVGSPARDGAKVTWSAPPGVCVCEYSVTITAGSAAPVTYATLGSVNSFSLCNMPASTSVTVTVAAVNRVATSTAAPPVVFTTPSSGSLQQACSAKNAPRFSIDIAGTNIATINANGVLAVPAVVGLLVFIVLGLLLTMAAADPRSACRARMLHAPCCAGCGRESAYGKLGSSLKKGVRVFGWRPFSDSPAYITSVALLALVFAITWALAAEFWIVYLPHAYMYDLDSPVWRGAGYAAAIALGATLIAPAKNGLWAYLLGASFERALRLHRWSGWMASLLVGIHGFGIGISYAKGGPGIKYVFTWSTAAPVNPLAGVLVGLFVLILVVLAADPIRRNFYRLFLAGHALWPLIVVFTWLHTKSSSEINSVLPLLLGVGLTLIDYLWRIFDITVRRTRVLEASVLRGDDGKPEIACMTMCKEGMPYAEPGSFVYVWVPAISAVPHPFSVSGSCAVLRSTHDGSVLSAFTVHIRGNGPETFTGKLVRRIAAGQRTGSGSGSSGGADAPAGSGVGLMRRFVGSFMQSASGHLQWPGDREWAAASSAAPSAMVAPGTVTPAAANGGSMTSAMGAPPPPLPAGMPSVRVFGPFGRLSLQIGRYAHVLLVAGGIGITPIASLHYALINRVPLPGHTEQEGSEADHYDDGSGSKAGAGCGKSCRRHMVAHDAGMPARSPLRSLLTVWTARGNSLIQEFAPLLLPAPIPLTAAAAEAAAAARAVGPVSPASASSAASSAASPQSGALSSGEYASTISVDGDSPASGTSISGAAADGISSARAPIASLASAARWPDGAPTVGLQIYCSTGGAGGRRGAGGGGGSGDANGGGGGRGGKSSGAAAVLASAGPSAGSSAGRDPEAGGGGGDTAGTLPALGNPLRSFSHRDGTGAPGDAASAAAGGGPGAESAAQEAAAALAPFIRPGRPPLHDILASVTRAILSHRGPPLAGGRRAESHKSHADKGANAVAVVVCGPAPLVEDTVAACHRASRDGAVRFDVHTETFEF